MESVAKKKDNEEKRKLKEKKRNKLSPKDRKYQCI